MQRTLVFAVLLAGFRGCASAGCASAGAAADAPRAPEATAIAPSAAPVLPDAAPPVAPPAPQAPVAAEAAPPPPIPPGSVVVHIGDSFALAGFAQALKPRMKALGVRYEVKAETSSFTTTWSGKIESLVANTQPDLVIINLGANEVSNVDPPAHAPAIRHIVAALKGRPCVWVSPPSWRKDTGIQDVIRQNSAPCRYFDSDKLVTTPIARQKDHIHPTEEGGAVWAAAFWSWLQAERASAPAPAAEAGKGPRPSPWRLKPSAPDEHDPQAH